MAVKLDAKFNGKSLSEDFGIGLLSYEIQSASSRKTRGVDIPGRDGMYKVKSTYSPKKAELKVVVEAETTDKVHKKIRTFLSWLSQQDEPQVVFTDNPDVFIKADLDESSEYYVTRGVENAMTQLTIDLYQYDPFTYDNGVISYSFEALSDKVYDILNEGIYTPYVIYLSAAKSALTQYASTSLGHSTMNEVPVASNVVIEVNGIKQTYNGILTIDDVLEINSKELTVNKNGESAISDWEGDIEDLVYGQNAFKMSNTEGIKLFVKIEFYRRWL